MSRVLVLAVDGLDWSMLLALAAQGSLPVTAGLLARGMSATLAHPAPHGPASHWATVASGSMADRHGICGELMRRPDGLLIEAPTAADLRCPPFWQRAWEAGRVAKVAGWPATLGSVLPEAAAPGSCLVADGFAFAELSPQHCWPLARGAVAPASERAVVREARVHPDLDVSQEAVAAVLDGLPSALTAPARRLLARWASVHNLGVHWAAQQDWRLLALRFDGLPDWLAALDEQGVAGADGVPPWCRYLDLMLGRYLALVGDDTHLLLLTETGARSSLDTRLGMRLAGAGGLLLAGPGIAPGLRDLPANGLDVHPTVLGLLGIAVSEEPQGDDTLPSAPVLNDAVAADWLRGQGLAAADCAALRARASAVQAANLAGWAAARAAQGRHADAAEAMPSTADLSAGLRALARRDWGAAERLLAAALRAEAANAPAWLGWYQACIALGRTAEAQAGLRLARALMPGHAPLHALKA